MSNTKLLGRWGEAQAAQYLVRAGYRIVAASYQCRMGEIDLIAQKKNVLTFVEVKLRRNDSFAAAREHVTTAKQNRIRVTAEAFLAEYPDYADLICRFDVVEIYAPEGMDTRHPIINLVENAFC